MLTCRLALVVDGGPIKRGAARDEVIRVTRRQREAVVTDHDGMTVGGGVHVQHAAVRDGRRVPTGGLC